MENRPSPVATPAEGLAELLDLDLLAVVEIPQRLLLGVELLLERDGVVQRVGELRHPGVERACARPELFRCSSSSSSCYCESTVTDLNQEVRRKEKSRTPTS